jgi:molybdopterin molybdotransferase
MGHLISYEDALTRILNIEIIRISETVSLSNSLGRVLAEDIYSDSDMPPFDKSAMDGYACRRADLKNELEIVDEIPAGILPKFTIGINQCAKIMTGAMVPEGADCVIMVEHVTKISANKITFNNESTSTNICYQGEDVKKGDTLIYQNTLLKPHHLAILASVGKANLHCYQRPLVGVLSTGDELVEPGDNPKGPQIRNSNGPLLVSLVKECGIETKYYGIVPDRMDILESVMLTAISECDVILVSGGVSAGDYDFVPNVLAKHGAMVIINKVNIQPGKPILFGKVQDKYFFGLPGNPVSCLIQFILLVKPFLYTFMGFTDSQPEIKATLGKQYFLKKANQRLLLVPVHFRNNEVVPVKYNGSAHIAVFANANAIMFVPAGTTVIQKGEQVRIQIL